MFTANMFDSINDENTTKSMKSTKLTILVEEEVRKYIENHEEIKATWSLNEWMDKGSIEMLKKLAMAIKYFLILHPNYCKDKNCPFLFCSLANPLISLLYFYLDQSLVCPCHVANMIE